MAIAAEHRTWELLRGFSASVALRCGTAPTPGAGQPKPVPQGWAAWQRQLPSGEAQSLFLHLFLRNHRLHGNHEHHMVALAPQHAIPPGASLRPRAASPATPAMLEGLQSLGGPGQRLCACSTARNGQKCSPEWWWRGSEGKELRLCARLCRSRVRPQGGAWPGLPRGESVSAERCQVREVPGFLHHGASPLPLPSGCISPFSLRVQPLPEPALAPSSENFSGLPRAELCHRAALGQVPKPRP